MFNKSFIIGRKPDTGVEHDSPMFQLTNSSSTVMFHLIGPKSATTCCANNYQAKFDVSIALNIANICSFLWEFSYVRSDLLSVPTLI